MSMTTCRECGGSVSSQALKCPACGIKNPAKSKHALDSVGNFISGAIGLFIILGAIGYFAGAGNKAECELLDRSLNEDVFFINGEPDAGYRYNVQVRNNGEKGEITVRAKLSTSEGEFEREQKLEFDSQATSNLAFNFHEPTINVRNVQGSVTCRP